VNFSLFDKNFFDGMFDNFYFPDGTQPKWESLNWLQKDFLHWFNQERLRCILTFPVVSCTLLYKDNEFKDNEFYEFICDEYAQGNSFFLYISDTVDSLSSCCRLKNKIQTKEFSFTNGNMGVETGSKSVISLNLNRIVQDYASTLIVNNTDDIIVPREYIAGHINLDSFYDEFLNYLKSILDRIYKYQTAYNELLWDMYNAGLLPVYNAGFIDLNKQYLTIGLIGTSAAAEFLGIEISNNPQYQKFCQTIFGFIKEQNTLHKTKKTTWNTEQVPAESAGVKLYNADKEDGYWIPEDINLYTSYIYKPYDTNLSFLDRIVLHGKDFIGDYLDGGSSAHLNLDTHLDKQQYEKILKFAAEKGCQYLTFNVPNSECEDCGFITKVPITKCPKCGSTKIALYDRIIGYLTKISNWSQDRQIEQKTRVYSKNVEI
jgi:ribonucleoside-triphosphate reductase